MTSPVVKLRMADGSTRCIVASLGKDCRLVDRVSQIVFSLIKGQQLKPSRLDRELDWLLDCISIEEPDSRTEFADTKEFVTTLNKISEHFANGTVRGTRDRKLIQ